MIGILLGFAIVETMLLVIAYLTIRGKKSDVDWYRAESKRAWEVATEYKRERNEALGERNEMRAAIVEVKRATRHL